MDNDLNARLLAVENELKNLKENSTNTSLNESKKKETKQKKNRQPTEYNKFMSLYINEQKEKLGENFKHKMAFSEGAKKWKEQKEKSSK